MNVTDGFGERVALRGREPPNPVSHTGRRLNDAAYFQSLSITLIPSLEGRVQPGATQPDCGGVARKRRGQNWWEVMQYKYDVTVRTGSFVQVFVL